MTEQLIQGSEAWKAARLGRVTASRVADIMRKTKSGYSATRANYLAQLVCERLTGEVAESFKSSAMEWGSQYEADARAAYEFRYDVEIELVGLVDHPTIPMAAASPDGLIGTDGLIETKCPLSATHIETLLGKQVPTDYETQIHWQLACTGRKWCDYVSFDPRMPESMSLFVKRVHRDDARIAELEKEVRAFLAELDRKVADLTAIYIERRDPLVAALKQSAALAGAA